MKTKFLLFVSLVLLAVQGWAAPVDESAARTIVQKFMINEAGYTPNSVPSSGGYTLQLLHAEVSSVNVMQNAYYIFNTGDGFVIVSGDDRAEQILGYGDEDLDMEDIPCCMQFMLDSYKEQIDYLFEHPGLVVETPSMNEPRLAATNVSPMLTAKWGQRKPYYNLTPVYNGSHCKTGCSCVALCQVMHYWKKPTTPVPSLPSYISKFRGVTITVPELPSDRFYWNYIKDSYSGSYTDDEAYSIAKLMRYVGQAEHMGYTTEASGASTDDILVAAKLFGYNCNAKRLDRDDYTDAEWKALIQTELSAGRPIIYSGFNSSHSVGHAFNLDGYRSSDKKYHMNWGFRGNGDGYYALNAFNPLNNNFNYMQDMIVDLEPQNPEIVIITPATLSFSAMTGEIKTATFSFRGYALTGDLTVKLNNGGSIYSIDKTSITMSDASYRTTVTVTYKPTEPGTSSASVTISGGGATAKTVSLSGSAYPSSTIYVNPSSLSFSAATGETKTAPVTVSCPNAISDLSLKLNNGGSIYSIDKTSISKSAAINGATVTVTYKPTEAGSSNASINISGGGAEPKTVSISGTAVKPVITVDPTSLYFSAIVGETKTATFTVTATDNLASDLSVKMRSQDTSVSFDKPTISKNDAINGTTVTVTYRPIASESRYTFIDISGVGVDTKSIDLTTHAYMPEITVEPDSLSFSSYVNNPVRKTFKVKGYNLTNDLSFAFSDTTGTFRIGSINTMIPGSNFTSNVEVVYNPAVTGTSTCILTINCGTAEPKTIHLSGEAEDLPNVEVDVNSISFESTYTGYQSSRTITITCPNLNKNLQLNLSNDNTNSFGLSKSTVTPEAAAAGVPVTVYFSPTTGGGKHAKLNICYDGCKVVTIPVTGNAIKSDGYITAWPTELSFETQAGTPVTQTFHVTYSAPNGSIMISCVGGGDVTGSGSESGGEGSLLNLNAINGLSNWPKSFIQFDSINRRRKELIGPIEPVLLKSLVLELTGDDCFEITPSRIRLSSVPCDAYVTVTYHPDSVGEHDATVKIKLSMGSAKPFILPLHGTATAQLFAPSNDNGGNDLMITQSGSSINTLVNERLMNAKVYADGQNIIIECPETDNAIISDIAGHSWKVNLQAGLNVIPVNASGIFIVRIREKTTKLMLK